MITLHHWICTFSFFFVKGPSSPVFWVATTQLKKKKGKTAEARHSCWRGCTPTHFFFCHRGTVRCTVKTEPHTPSVNQRTYQESIPAVLPVLICDLCFSDRFSCIIQTVQFTSAAANHPIEKIRDCNRCVRNWWLFVAARTTWHLLPSVASSTNVVMSRLVRSRFDCTR